MVERNENRYQLDQNNKVYILTTVLVDDKLKLMCEISSSIFEGTFALMDLCNLSKYFKPTYTIEQVQLLLNGIIEKQRVGIKQNGEALVVILYLINKDQIFIPLIKRADNHDFNFDNYKYQQTSTTTTTQYINQPYYTKDVIPHEYLYNVTTDTNINPTYITPNQNQQNYYINSTKNIDISGAIPVSPGGNPGVPIQKKIIGSYYQPKRKTKYNKPKSKSISNY
jgi:hypothetical protein